MSRRLSPVALALAAALWPRGASAQDAPWDLDYTEPVDQMAYSFWHGIATMLWGLDRTLLGLAYQLDQLRHWLVEVAFAGAYAAVVEQVVGPLTLPLATIAILLFGLLFLLVPFTGRGAAFINLRQVLLLTLLLPALLGGAGPLLRDVEAARVALGALISTALRAGGGDLPGAIFGVPLVGEMAEVAPLYGGAPACGQALARAGLAGAAPPLRMDDLAAAALWATAEDIHCPPKNLPALFYVDAPDGPGYAREAGVEGIEEHSMRQERVSRMQAAVERLALGILPSLLAVVEMLIQLMFALALIAVWISAPFALLFMLFQRDATAIVGLARSAFSILRTSWAVSFVLGLVFVCLEGAARLGNPTASIGLSLGALVLCGSALSLAARTFVEGLAALGGSLGAPLSLPPGTAGRAARAGLRLAGGVPSGAAAAVGGAASAGLTFGAALQATGSRRYAAGAALGTLKPVARLGEVAAAMGAYRDDEALAGLRAGAVGGSLADVRRRAANDAERRLDDGTTIGERGRHAVASRLLAANNAEAATPLREAEGDAAGQGAPARRSLGRSRARGGIDPARSAVRLGRGRLVAMARRGRDEEGVATAEPGADVAWLMAQGYAWQRNEDGSISYWKHTPGERDTAMRERRDAGDADARRAPAKSDTP